MICENKGNIGDVMSENKHDLITLALEFRAATNTLKKAYQAYMNIPVEERYQKGNYNAIREQEYEVSKLYKAISSEKTRLWRESKNVH